MIQSNNHDNQLVQSFTHPSPEARPHTFWHWLNGNITKEGITADLEAMSQAGVGGVYLFNIEGRVVESVPVYVETPVAHLSPEWFDMLRHASAECKRLGMELSLMNCSGWTTSGGKHVLVEESMMRIAWSDTYVQGPGKVDASLPKPPCDYSAYQNLVKLPHHIHKSIPEQERFYRDVAVLAYKMSPSAARVAKLWPGKLSCSEADQNPNDAVDDDSETVVRLKDNGFVQFDFGEAVTIRGVDYLGLPGVLQASNDGTDWRNVTNLPAHRPWEYPQTFPVQETTARYFRVLQTGGGWLKQIKLSGESLVQDYGCKASFHGLWEDITVAEDRIGPATPAWACRVAKAEDVLDLTDRLQADGTLQWEAPEGDWMIVRIGYAPTGRLNAPCAYDLAGLECDKLSATSVENHFNNYAGRVAKEMGDLVGSGFNCIHVDSWEAGDINFSPVLMEEFRRRRGYDPTPFLLVHAGGRIVDDPAVSDRFLWDLRRTIADLITENYSRKMTELCHQNGLKFQGMVGGVMIQATIDVLQTKGQCDLPCGEFQMPNCVQGDNWARWDCIEAASTAHTYGVNLVGAEGYTTFDRWVTDPYALKGIGDLAFSSGINRLIFHVWAHHPFLDRAPGMTMGPFGVNFSRMDTWAGRPMKVFIDYLRRCQAMLMEGLYVADILYFYGEGAPNTLPMKQHIKPALPEGYSYDGCDADILRSRATVKDGRIMLPDGMSYRVLVLKEDRCMMPELLEVIRELVRAGATVIGPKPAESPSLQNYPQCDSRVKTLADELWGKIDGVTVTENAFGAGRVVWGPTVGDVLASMNVTPDVEIRQHNDVGPIKWIHRRQGEAEIYFLTNQQSIIDHGSSLEIWERRYDSYQVNELEKDTACFEAAFRVTGKQPELWDAVTGTRRDLTEFRVENGKTILPLSLAASGSCFVVFQRDVEKKSAGKADNNCLQTRIVTEMKGPWAVSFDPKWNGPTQATFETLEDWTARSEPEIKYYSGRATYRKTFDAPAETLGQQRVFLDLGQLRSLAEVRLNGRDLGVLWCPPWRVEITGLLQLTGNKLEIDIINLWANRLMGDLNLPKDKQITWSSVGDTISAFKDDSKLVPSGLYGPVRICIQ